jgi:molybdate transport system regulatory protein
MNHGTITADAMLVANGPARRIGPGLLAKVAELGSLRAAAANLELEEDLAWRYLVAANNLSEQPLIRTLSDGPVPTDHAQSLLGRSEALALAFERFLAAPGGGVFRQFHLRHQFLSRLAARTSARNQFYCRVQSVRRERVNAVVTLDLGGGDRLAAHITAHSAEELGLVAGRSCHALIDPAWVEVRADRPADRSPNCLRGRVVRILDDPVDAEVAIELPGGRIVLASMTRAEMAEKGIVAGRAARALIQSSQIILAVDPPPARQP